MVQYSGLRKWADAKIRDRAIDRLLALRAGLAKDVTSKSKLDSFHLASWNIRDLGGSRLNPSPRMDETFLYIAEVISAFDLVAVQEVNENLLDFERIMRLMGPQWDYIVTDQSGNMERLAFVYDTRKIRFRHVAGEIVLPKKKGQEPPQFNRTPFMVAFQAGWFKFNICTVHIYYGSDTELAPRIREIGDIAKFFTERQKKDGETYILLGDFNIIDPDHETMDALIGGGFVVPEELRHKTNLGGTHFYDQIAMRTQNDLAVIRSAGCFRWQDYVFREDDHPEYQPFMPTVTKKGKPAKTDKPAYKGWRTWQMSDHLPLWTEIKMDFTDSYLGSLKTGAKPLAIFKPATGPRPDAGPIEEPEE